VTSGASRRSIAVLCSLAGACDASTGLLLVAAPLIVLDLMGVAPAPAEPIYLRFIGVFVGGVGLAYLYPWIGARARRRARVATVLEATAALRLAVGAFVLASVWARALPAAWLLVAATDVGVAVAQIGLLWRGLPGEA